MFGVSFCLFYMRSLWLIWLLKEHCKTTWIKVRTRSKTLSSDHIWNVVMHMFLYLNNKTDEHIFFFHLKSNFAKTRFSTTRVHLLRPNTLNQDEKQMMELVAILCMHSSLWFELTNYSICKWIMRKERVLCLNFSLKDVLHLITYSHLALRGGKYP